MRWKRLALTLFAALACGFIGMQSASAADFSREAKPAGWGHERVVKHHVYYPRYHHVYATHVLTDPYAYRYEPRGYYPYYNSGYWRPAGYVKRPHYVLPRYYPAWGYTRHWHNKRWHTRHHGHHYPWHW